MRVCLLIFAALGLFGFVASLDKFIEIKTMENNTEQCKVEQLLLNAEDMKSSKNGDCFLKFDGIWYLEDKF